ncbi:MAG TPA: transketolase C-terminal domain-containing protein [Xanthobacteraceae bacterium]|nr:transketolase C-terminal domain-containing protein [Xanthobacteraceae bacterium]
MPSERVLSSAEAIREALAISLRRRPDVYLMGEGVADPGGIFGTTKGLVDEFGPDRVVEMPVAENGLTGIAIGSALMGMHPVMTHQRVDFALLCLEQLFNAAAKSSYVTGGRHKVPLTVRLVIGRGWGQGPQHSQSLEALFTYMPGLKVVMPSTPYEFKGLLLGAIEDENPVIMLEHRWLHYVTGAVPVEPYTVPLTGSRIVSEGDRATVVASSYMVLEALRAATALADVGCQIEVIDLRVLRPLNVEPIVDSVRKTGRLITCDTGWRKFGIGAEIVACIAERAHDVLKKPVARIGLPDHPTPSSIALAEVYYPDSTDIIEAVGRLCDLTAAQVDEARSSVIAARGGVPIDKPDPAFKGPF